jgi:hypothetical protein
MILIIDGDDHSAAMRDVGCGVMGYQWMVTLGGGAKTRSFGRPEGSPQVLWRVADPYLTFSLLPPTIIGG